MPLRVLVPFGSLRTSTGLPRGGLRAGLPCRPRTSALTAVPRRLRAAVPRRLRAAVPGRLGTVPRVGRGPLSHVGCGPLPTACWGPLSHEVPRGSVSHGACCHCPRRSHCAVWSPSSLSARTPTPEPVVTSSSRPLAEGAERLRPAPSAAARPARPARAASPAPRPVPPAVVASCGTRRRRARAAWRCARARLPCCVAWTAARAWASATGSARLPGSASTQTASRTISSASRPDRAPGCSW